MNRSILARFGERFRPAGLWLHSGFLKLWAAETVSGFGSQVTIVALLLLAALVLDASPLQMGLLSAASTAPFLLIGLVVGVLVDRVRCVPLLVVSDVARAALLVVIPAAWMFGWLNMGLLYAVALITGAFTVVFEVAVMSLLPALVGRKGLVEGNGKLEASRSLAQVGGPGIAGWLVGLLGAPMTILLDAGSYLFSAVFLMRLRVSKKLTPHLRKSAGACCKTFWRDCEWCFLIACCVRSFSALQPITSSGSYFFLYTSFTSPEISAWVRRRLDWSLLWEA